jgi:hypothetical protein
MASNAAPYVENIVQRGARFSKFRDVGKFSFMTHNRLRLSLHSSSLVRSTRR